MCADRLEGAREKKGEAGSKKSLVSTPNVIFSDLTTGTSLSKEEASIIW
jgi:hypothetical protein